MNKAKLILLSAMLLIAGAVGVFGYVVTRPVPKQVVEHSWLPDELNLTPPQKEQMQAIWTRTMQAVVQKNAERRKALRDERDAAVTEILSPDQRLEVEQIQQAYTNSSHELDRQKDEAFKKAVEETKGILTNEQVLKYEKILNDRRPRGDREGRRPPGVPRRSSDGRGGESRPLEGSVDFRPTAQPWVVPATRPVAAPAHVE